MADLEKNIKIGVDLSDLQLGVHEAINSIQGFWSSVETGSRNSAQSFEMMTSAFQSQSSVIQVGIRDTERFSETFVQVQQTSQVALTSYTRDLATVQKEQENANGAAKRWAESTKVVFGLLAQGAPAFFGKFITETINAEKQQAQLSAMLKSTGEAAGWSQERLNGMAASLSKSSVFSSGEITQAQTQLLTYSNVVGQQFPQAMQAVVDMSSRMGTSVTSSAETIGQALNSPSEGLKALADKGVQFTDQQKEMVAQLEATGQVGAAQAVILDALQTSYGGAAVAARDTLGGALEALQNSFATAMTGDSGSLQGMRESIESLNETLSSEATRAGFQTVISGLAGIVELAATGISVIGQFANAISMNIKGAQHASLERQFDFAKTELDRLQSRLRLDPGKNNVELQEEAKRLRDTMVRASLEMQKITASMAKQAGVAIIPSIDVPAVEVGTRAVQAQTEAVTKNAAQLGATAQASSRAVTQGATASTDAAKNAQVAYQRLRTSIQSKTEASENDIEVAARLKDATKDTSAQIKRDVEAYKEQLAVQEELAKAYAKQYDEATRVRLAVNDLRKAAENDTKRLELEASLIGASNAERKVAIQLYDLQIEKQKQLDLVRNVSYPGSVEDARKARAVEEANVEEIYAQKAANIAGQAYIEEWSSTVQKVEDIFVSGLTGMLNNGKSGWDSFCKSLKSSFSTMVAKEIYAMFAKPFVVQLVGSFMGVMGGVGRLLGGFASDDSSGGNLLGTASNINTIYSVGSAAYAGSLGNYFLQGPIASGANYLGVGNLTTSIGNYLNWGTAKPTLDMLLGTGSSSAASAGGGGAGLGYGAGWAAAAVMAAAYLGGMFKEEKQVGSGLMGELGGDMYGYQLMRESGSLFGGPKYRYLAAEKEIEKANAQIETLQGQIAANPEAKENGYRERQLQQLYSRVEMLQENYGTAIEGSKGPIKVLQDAFKDMREDTAKKADTLGLNGDAIRAMKVALGLDEIHPDTGGKGLQLTGLSQEEASAKIQQALAQANEELARSVLGSWQEQTREVTRMVWDNVQVAGDSDTEQWARVGRQVTETVTEQIFVMSEYVRTGEKAVDALTRMSSSLVGVNQIFELFGSTLLEGSLSAGDWASKLVDAVGSMDALTQAASTYYDLYYSDDEKRSRASKVANDGMEERGLDLRVGDVDAKKKYRALVDKAIADRDEELLAWLLQFADDFANGVDAVTASLEDGTNALAAKLQEIQQIREETLSTLGLSMDGLVDGFINEINEGRGAEAGSWLANQISAGFEQAVYEQAINTILSSMIDGMITPMLTAALTGANVADAVSGAAIDNMISNANAAIQALNTLLTSTEFVEGMEKLKVSVKSLGNSIGVSVPKMRSYQGGVSNLGSSYDSSAKAANSAADAAKKLADQWSKTIDAMANEMKRLRGQLLGSGPDQGAAYYESLFAIKTAQARSGNQDAADELPSIIQALEALAKASATSQADVLLKQSAWLASLADTRNFLAHKYGVDIGDVKTAEVGAATAGRVVQASGNTALLSALQASSDNPVLVAEVRALRLSLDNHDANRKAEATVVVPAVQQLNKTLRMWDADGMPATRKQEENA